MSKLNFIFNNGKNPKWKFFAKGFFQYITPKWFCQRQLQPLLKSIDLREDKDYIYSRVNYYNQLIEKCVLPDSATYLKDHKWGKKVTSYLIDSYEYSRYFNPSYKWCTCFGDVTWVPQSPSIVKSRPIQGENTNSILLNLDKVRHFIFIQDKKKFEEKKDAALFRGKVNGKPNRIECMKKFFGQERVSVGAIDKNPPVAEWHTEKLTLWQQLEYRYILALEGNDVASNLKWVMSSNSIAMMPQPKYETWFMEAKLIPNYHYIEIQPDFSDIEEKMDYYSEHLDEALLIIQHAHEYVQQFQDKKREKLISLAVLNKYFEMTNDATTDVE